MKDGKTLFVDVNTRILNPLRVKELYDSEGEAVTWGSYHYKYIMNEVIRNRHLSLIIVTLKRENAGADWKLIVSKSNLRCAISPQEWVKLAKTTRWLGENFDIHYELMDSE